MSIKKSLLNQNLTVLMVANNIRQEEFEIARSILRN